MKPLDAFLYGAFIAALIGAAALGVVNSQVYKDWRAEQEQKQTVYTFGEASNITTSADAALPDMVVVTGGGE